MLRYFLYVRLNRYALWGTTREPRGLSPTISRSLILPLVHLRTPYNLKDDSLVSSHGNPVKAPAFAKTMLSNLFGNFTERLHVRFEAATGRER